MASSNVKITILASEWGASWEEPWTIIRELAIQLAKSSGVDITFFVPQCSDKDKKEALRHKVHILKATPLVGFEELEWLSFPPQHLKIDIIIGHGVKLGRQAQVIKNSHKCKWVQVVHSHPEELGMFKSYPNPITTGEEKHSVEMELCKIADFVVGVGPKLSEAFRNYLRRFKKDKPIFDLTPGVFNEFINVNLAPEERTHRSVLVFGRGDAEDFELKGFDIAARAVAALPDTHLVFFEESKGNLEEVERRFLHCGVPANRLRVRSYDKNQESLKGSFRKVDLVLMPSRTDGFGLSGLVALSAGIPVLVSKNSGLGEALSKVPFSSSFVIDSEDPERWAAAIKALWKKDPQSRLEKAEALRSYYMSKYSWSKQSDALLFQMMNLVKEVSEILFAEAPYSSLDLRYAGFLGEADALSYTRRQMDALLLQRRYRPFQGSKSRPGEYSAPAMRYAVSESRPAKPEYWTPHMRSAEGWESLFGKAPYWTPHMRSAVDPFIRRPESQSGASAQQVPDVDDGNSSEDEEEVDDGNGCNVGEEVTEGGEQLPQQLHEVQTEEQHHVVEEEANKIRVYEGQVTSEGAHLDLKLGAVHLTFPPDAVCESTSIVVHKWKSSVCSPQLQEHEANVSNVIEISTTTNEALQFNVGVKLVFSHCAPDLLGYELVIKRLTNKETNDWKEVEGTVDARQLSDIVDEYPKEVPDFSFPVVQADIAECSIFTVICRLIPSPTYTISSRGGCFHHPDYPGVVVTVPKKAVPVKSKFPLHLKVQEVPNDEFKDGNVYVGPILRISCTQGIEFLKPVTIQLPFAPRVEGGTIPGPSICRVRVLFLRSNGENKEWVEITDDLENPARFDGSSVTFQVKRFSGYTYIIIPYTAEQVAVSSLHSLHHITRISPILASFFAYFRPSERIRSQDLLHLVCCPAHLRSQVKEELVRDGVSLLELYEISSGRGMVPGHDKAFVFVSGGIRPANEEYMGEVYLLLDASCQHRNQLPIRLISDQEYCLVEFRSFANLHFRLPSRQVQIETSPGFRVKLGSPTDEELQAITGRIGGKWKALGRQLKILESQLTGFDRDQPDEYEKAYAVLVEWKQRGGSENATYQILKEALCHALVGRRDLAEEFCCLNNSVS